MGNTDFSESMLTGIPAVGPLHHVHMHIYTHMYNMCVCMPQCFLDTGCISFFSAS